MALIYDVGMHNGDDTAFYVHQGHSVVAVEANPLLAEAGRKRFRDPIASGLLTIVNVAIDERAGERDFWVCDDSSDWSSFDREIASRDGAKHHSVKVRTARFADILAEFGCPHYLKVDIEGHDHLCLRDLLNTEPPPYISVESECAGSEKPLAAEEYLRNLRLLKECGYRYFKLIRQNDFCPLYKSGFYQQMTDVSSAILHDTSRRYRVLRALGKPLWASLVMGSRLEKRNQWKFPMGSSGPWGSGTFGRWLTYSEAQDTYEHCRAEFFRQTSRRLYEFWCDWHATTLPR